MHIISHGLASLVGLISLNESSGKWIVFLKFVIAGSLIIAENTGNGQVFRSSVEHDSCWLGVWRSHVNGTKINCIISTVEGDLELQVILVIFGSIGNFADKLGDMGVRPSTFLSLLAGFDEVTVI